MITLFLRTAAACAFALAAAGLCLPAGAAPASHPKAEAVLKAKAKKHAAKPEAEVVSNEPEPDITDTITVEYNCELGNKVTLYTNEGDTSHMALRWKKRVHLMTRVGTTTGASRFENATFGLIWIGIPAKSMLLDSRLNRQLANDCKNAEQSRPAS